MRVVLMALLAVGQAHAQSPDPGSSGCAECHPDQAERHAASPHARALKPILESDLPERLLALPLRERGGVRFVYEIHRDGLSATAERYRDDSLDRLTEKASGMLEWTFGAGSQGQTAVGRAQGRYFEHRVSYYAKPAKPAITLGHPLAPPRRARDLLGLPLDAEATFRCFGCHATGARFSPDGVDLRGMTPGVQCDRCHGGAAAHAEAARRDPLNSLTGLSALGDDAGAMVAFCGTCHRNSSSDMDNGDPLEVRFQPIGLVRSRCFQKSGRLACTTCHDPHEAASRRPDPYVKACLGCHPGETNEASAGCGRASEENCLPCHMPRTAPNAYLEFTDHRIRVRKKSADR